MPYKTEVLRQENIKRNQEKLAHLLENLKKKNAAEDVHGPQPKRVGRKSARDKLKKRMRRTSNDEIEVPRPTKRARPETLQSGLRRSLRNAGKETPDYQGESQVRLPRLVAKKVGMDHDGDPRQPSGKRIHDPYV